MVEAGISLKVDEVATNNDVKTPDKKVDGDQFNYMGKVVNSKQFGLENFTPQEYKALTSCILEMNEASDSQRMISASGWAADPRLKRLNSEALRNFLNGKWQSFG